MVPLPFSGELKYAVIFWVAYAVWALPEFTAWRSKCSGQFSKARDRGSLLAILVLFWTGFALDFWFALWLRQAAIPWARTPLFFIGVGLVLAGIALRWSAIGIMGRYFTLDVAIHAGQRVIEKGPYRYIRHPSYAGTVLSAAGIGLALGNWAGLLAVLACVGIAYGYRIRVEEEALIAGLGEPYRQYMRRTWRVVPFVF